MTPPIKEVLREISFWLEWRRTIDMATEAFHTGFVLNEILGMDDFQPSRAQEYARAIDCARRNMNTRLVAQAVFKVVEASKGELRAIAGLLLSLGTGYIKAFLASLWARLLQAALLRGSSPGLQGKSAVDQDGPASGFERRWPETRQVLDRLVQRLRAAIATLPQDHLEHLRKRLRDCGV